MTTTTVRDDLSVTTEPSRGTAEPTSQSSGGRSAGASTQPRIRPRTVVLIVAGVVAATAAAAGVIVHQTSSSPTPTPVGAARAQDDASIAVHGAAGTFLTSDGRHFAIVRPSADEVLPPATAATLRSAGFAGHHTQPALEQSSSTHPATGVQAHTALVHVQDEFLAR